MTGWVGPGDDRLGGPGGWPGRWPTSPTVGGGAAGRLVASVLLYSRSMPWRTPIDGSPHEPEYETGYEPEYEIESRILGPQDTAVVRRGVAADELTSWASGVFGTISSHLQRINVPTTGNPFVLYLERGDHNEVEAGFPVAERITSKDEVRFSSLPGGPALTTWHRGHPHDIGDAFEAIAAWLQRQAAEATSPAWVVHHPDLEAESDAPSGMMEVIQPYQD